jgi:hypothetical protein
MALRIYIYHGSKIIRGSKAIPHHRYLAHMWRA